MRPGTKHGQLDLINSMVETSLSQQLSFERHESWSLERMLQWQKPGLSRNFFQQMWHTEGLWLLFCMFHMQMPQLMIDTWERAGARALLRCHCTWTFCRIAAQCIRTSCDCKRDIVKCQGRAYEKHTASILGDKQQAVDMITSHSTNNHHLTLLPLSSDKQSDENVTLAPLRSEGQVWVTYR